MSVRVSACVGTDNRTVKKQKIKARLLFKTWHLICFCIVCNKVGLPGAVCFAGTRYGEGFEIGVLRVDDRGYGTRSPTTFTSVGIDIFYIHGRVHAQSGAH